MLYARHFINIVYFGLWVISNINEHIDSVDYTN